MLTEDFEQAQNLSSQVEQARQRAVLAASDAGAARDDAWNALHAAREHANATSQVVDGAERARDEAQAAADRAEAPTDSMVATLAGNPVSLTRAAVDQATGDMITTEGSTTQAAGDSRWVTKAGADILVAAEIERTGSETQVSGDNRWVTNEGVDNTVSALFSAPDSAVQTAADSRYNRRGEDRVLVTDFGAVGDGATNNDAAFNAAIAYAYGTFGQGGKTVVFPAGDYVTYQRINLKGNLQYEAYGATFRKPNVAAGYAVFYTRSNGAKGYGSGDSNIVWRGGTFKGNFTTDNMICPFALHHTNNAQFFDITCIETQGIGHNFDLNGCSNIRIENLVAYGFKNPSTSGYNKSEFIQIDLSMSSATSAPDTAGSYDGLMTRDVLVTRCQFRSITVGGVFYPAPNPLGSHVQHETRVPTNIRMESCVIENPFQDTASGLQGVVHFLGGKNIQIVNNEIYYTSASATFSTTLISFYSTNWAVPISTATYEGAANTLAAVASPLVVDGVKVAGNKIYGVRATTTEPIVKVVNKDDSTVPVSATNILLESNEIVVDSGSSALNAYQINNAENVYFKGSNSVKGPARAVQAADTKNVQVDWFHTVGNRADAIRFDNFDGLSILSTYQRNSAGSSIYLNAGSNAKLQNLDVGSLGGSRAVAINTVSRFSIVSVNTLSPSGVVGIQVYSASSSGFVNNVISTGGTANAVTNSSSSVTVTNSLVA